MKCDINGCHIINIDKFSDNRGIFSSAFKENHTNYQLKWGKREIKQVNISHNLHKGTVRGIHVQKEPHEEAKLISCLKGSIFDVVVDLRINSPTYLNWLSIILSAENNIALLVPEGCGHGFQTLENDTIVHYIHSNNYAPEENSGIIWCDEKLSIPWPLKPSIISSKDAALPRIKNDSEMP